MNYLVNTLLAVAFATTIAGSASGGGEAFATTTYVTACALAVLSLIVGVSAARHAAPVGGEMSTLSIGNDGASRTGAEK